MNTLSHLPLRKRKRPKKIIQRGYEKDQEYYNKITDILYNKHYEKYIETGKFKEKDARAKAEKEAIEDARYVFPNACETKIVFTMNARSLMNFFRLRTCERAQWEIRELATEMLKKKLKKYILIYLKMQGQPV